MQRIHLYVPLRRVFVLEWLHRTYMLTFSMRKCLVLNQNLNTPNRYNLDRHRYLHAIPLDDPCPRLHDAEPFLKEITHGAIRLHIKWCR